MKPIVSDEEMFAAWRDSLSSGGINGIRDFTGHIEVLVRRRLAERLREEGRPHTYASENADFYRAYQAGCERAARIVESDD